MGRTTALRGRGALRKVLHRLGFDIVRYPLHDPAARTARLLAHHGVECVIDVGANDGGFATSIREHGYAGEIISFEPLKAPFELLRQRAQNDGKWRAVRVAVGAEEANVAINVSGNRALSSSILPMLEAHRQAAPHSAYVGVEAVRQDRLDVLLWEAGFQGNQRAFLKIDVQGYERAVLDGAEKIFAEANIVGVQLELSFVPLYDGGMSYREAFEFADRRGMTIMGIDPVFADTQTGQLLQADAVFFARQDT